MKIHITNLYNFNKDDILVKKQHQFADAGLALSFLEMGIFSYPVETDTPSELSKRIDGIIAALESEDLVFLQLPTENGYIYEQQLIHKIKAYNNTKLVLILHNTLILSDKNESESKSKYLTLYKMADAIIAPTACERNLFTEYGLSKLLFCDDVQLSNIPHLSEDNSYGLSTLCQNNFYIKKTLMDAIDTVFSHQKEVLRSTIQTSDNVIHIGFGLHDKTGNYSTWVGTAIQSIVEHTNSSICFHILHDKTLSEANKNKFMQVAADAGDSICFHLLDEALFSDIQDQMSFYTIGAMFRIMLPEILTDLSKIIYLDADILVNRDIKDLWNVDIDDYCLAAVPDMQVIDGTIRPIPVKRNEVKADRYFNSGVLYMNLERIRKKSNMRCEIIDYLKNTKDSDLPDQDALNVIYRDETLLLDGTWNYFTKISRRNGEKKLEPKIYHYVGTPCLLYYLTEIDQLYFETTGRTPWRLESCRNQLRKNLERTTDRITQLEKLLFQISDPKKKRIFYGAETMAMKNLYQRLSPRAEDYRVLSEPDNVENCILPCKPLSALFDETEAFVVFVLPEADNGSAIRRLEEFGLQNEKDFFVIPRLLLPHEGGYV